MTSWRTMFDCEWLYAEHLEGKDVVVTIDAVAPGAVRGSEGKPEKKPVLTFVGKSLPFALCKTNCKIVSALYGATVENWAGKPITLYPTTCLLMGETVACIRIRPVVPAAAKGGAS